MKSSPLAMQPAIEPRRAGRNRVCEQEIKPAQERRHETQQLGRPHRQRPGRRPPADRGSAVAPPANHDRQPHRCPDCPPQRTRIAARHPRRADRCRRTLRPGYRHRPPPDRCRHQRPGSGQEHGRSLHCTGAAIAQLDQQPRHCRLHRAQPGQPQPVRQPAMLPCSPKTPLPT